MKQKLILTAIIFLLTNIIANSQSFKVPIVDLNKDYPGKDIKLKDNIVSDEYVKLETKDGSLIKNIGKLDVNDHYIVVTDLGTKEVLTFDRKGKFLSKVSKVGGGPQEYPMLYTSCVDLGKKEVFIWGQPTAPVIKIYGFDGTFKRTLAVTGKSWPDEMVDYDPQNILIYSSKCTPNYFLVSKATGKVSSFPSVGTKTDLTNKIMTDDGNGNAKLYMTALNRINKYGEETIVSDFSASPVYKAEGKKLIPLFSKKNVGTLNDGKLATVFKVIGDLYFMTVIPTKYNPSKKRVEFLNSEGYDLCIDVKNNSIFKIGSLDVPVGDVFDITLPKNTNASSFSTDILLLLKNRGTLNPELSRVFSTMKKDDNPVIRITTFKSTK